MAKLNRNPEACLYMNLMGKDKRTILIVDEEHGPFAIIAFSITNETLPYASKRTWEYMPHNPKGTICFIEKMIAVGFNRKMLDSVGKLIFESYPAVERGVWYRTSFRSGQPINKKMNVWRKNLCMK